MKKTRLGRMIILVLTVAMVFASATTAFAEERDIPSDYVTGGPSQYVENGWALDKDEPNSMDMDFDGINWHGQSGLKFRGYKADTTTACTILKSVWSEAYYCATYTTHEVEVDAKISISSSSTSDWLWYEGRIIA